MSEEKSETEVISAPKKRGRKLGFTTGPRPTIYVASAIIKDQIVMERFSSPAGPEIKKDEVLSFNEEDVKAAFEAKFGVEPDVTMGPFYDVKGISIKTTRKRDTITIPLSDLNLSETKKPAIFRGWRGAAWEIKGRTDVMFFMPDSEVTPSTDPKKRMKPKASPVMLSALTLENVAQSN